MDASDATKLESWIDVQLKGGWPDAEALGHENRAGDHYFPIRAECGDRCLIVADRAYRNMAADELTDFLDDEHWLHRLQAEKCLRVQLPGLRPSLARPPDLVRSEEGLRSPPRLDQDRTVGGESMKEGRRRAHEDRDILNIVGGNQGQLLECPTHGSDLNPVQEHERLTTQY